MSKLMNPDSFSSYSLELFPLADFESPNFHPIQKLQPLGQLQSLQHCNNYNNYNNYNPFNKSPLTRASLITFFLLL